MDTNQAGRTAVDHMEINGRAAADDAGLRAAAFNGYAHFTAMQVRAGRVRGIALHTARLDAGHRELFGAPLDGERVRELVRGALARAGVSAGDAAVRVYGYGPDDVLVTVRPPMDMPPGARSLLPVAFAREFPHVKHLGSFGQTRHRVLAEQAGHDDALLSLPDGTVTEGSVANMAFWDGSSVVWPDAPQLRGTTMELLAPLLPSVRRRVTLEELAAGAYDAAFVTNARGIAPVGRIGERELAVDEELMKGVREAYEGVAWDEV
ncbi:aminotransferase class IV [Streptomyces sp. NPDC050504]|uniref:aminotransferase class IV n=1 Tax=Streptomyces sp. NPDC050504 TaxID=3365618 RepID=UPI0037B736DB